MKWTTCGVKKPPHWEEQCRAMMRADRHRRLLRRVCKAARRRALARGEPWRWAVRLAWRRVSGDLAYCTADRLEERARLAPCVASLAREGQDRPIFWPGAFR